MIARIWRGWTSTANAAAYKALLLQEIFPAIRGRATGLHGIDLLQRPSADIVEFATVLWFESLDHVGAFAGADVEAAVVPPAAQALLTRFEDRASHYDVLGRFTGSFE